MVTRLGSKVKQFVLITGASSGIGKAIALHLANDCQFEVIATVRNTTDAEALETGAANNIHCIVTDVTSTSDVSNAATFVESIVGDTGLFALINNAGIAVSAPMECISLLRLREQFEVNVFGTIAITQAVLPSIRMAKGRILNIGSISGRVTLPFMGAYSASKAALERITLALRLELYPWDISVSLLELGNFKTPIWNKSLGTAKSNAEDYSEQCKSAYSEHLLRAEQLVASRSKSAADVQDIVTYVEKLLRKKNLKAKYTIGIDAKRWILRLTFLPRTILDAMIRKAMGLQKQT